MKKNIIVLVLALLPLGLMAQEQENLTSASSQTEQQQSNSQKKKSAIFTGFSGGMMLHIGYQFSDDPRKIFSNSGLGSSDYLKGLPTNGLCYGIGGTARIHLLDHIHLGAEGGMSIMPLMGTGSSIRNGWGGAACDIYTEWGIARPLLGLMVGGGSMSRLYVPSNALVTITSGDEQTNYNASYTKTPYFLLDPYVGVEIALKEHTALLLRIDYMLPFGRSTSNLVTQTEGLNWNRFLTPSGPRLYIGFMFGNFKRKTDNG